VVIRALTAVGAGIALVITGHTVVNLRSLRTPRRDATPHSERVSLLIPARNEQAHIEQTVRSALAQQEIDGLEVIVLNDGSTDRTSEILASITDPRLTVITGGQEPLPPGWLGKPWACARLARRARGSVLVFIDADVHLEPWATRAALAEMRTGSFALIAPYPRQVATSWLERLIQPLVTWSWAATLPLGWAERSHRPSLSAANGQFIVVDAGAYRSVGGHACVRGEIVEDVALMRALKTAGHLTATVDGSSLAQCRMYEGAGQVADGYAKSLWSAFGGPAGSIALNAILLTAYVVPAAAMVVSRDRRTRALGFTGYAAGVASRAFVARRTGERVWPDAAAHPASILAFSALNAVSWRRHLRGTNSWKGRPV
jgi:Glycosyl transferase family 2